VSLNLKLFRFSKHFCIEDLINKPLFEIIAIGGSAGSLPVLINILKVLPDNFSIPIVIVVHRLKNAFSEMDKILAVHFKQFRLCEPEDKTPIEKNHIYLAPQNYHLLVEEDKTFSLDYSELINYTRPSIDVSFNSISYVYHEKALAILLSGANRDGAEGIDNIILNGGTGIVQNPETAEYTAMPQSAINKNEHLKILYPQQIIDYISSLHN